MKTLKLAQLVAIREWLALPDKQREEVLWALRFDHESWAHSAGEDEYPGEARLRANATRLAIEALGGKLVGD